MAAKNLQLMDDSQDSWDLIWDLRLENDQEILFSLSNTNIFTVLKSNTKIFTVLKSNTNVFTWK